MNYPACSYTLENGEKREIKAVQFWFDCPQWHIVEYDRVGGDGLRYLTRIDGVLTWVDGEPAPWEGFETAEEAAAAWEESNV